MLKFREIQTLKISLLVTPFDDQNLARAAQIGVDEIVAVYPGLELNNLRAICDRVDAFGMRVGIIERLIPSLKFVHNEPGRDEQIEDFKVLIRNMGECGVSVLCYSWMPDDDWQRTNIQVRERGGALVTEFDMSKPSDVPTSTGHQRCTKSPTSAQQQWDNLEHFLNEVVPIAEDAGVKLSMHPTDPPLPSLRGLPRIMTHPLDLERLVQLVDSDSNGLCFCQGTFATCEEEIDMPAWIRRLRKHINFAHFRDVVGKGKYFRETFHDNGKTDMVACMTAYYESMLDIPIRPDHAPTLAGESNEFPGYHMLGRLYAIGYMRGLMQATEKQVAMQAEQPHTSS